MPVISRSRYLLDMDSVDIQENAFSKCVNLGHAIIGPMLTNF